MSNNDNKMKEQETEYTRKGARNKAVEILQPYREEQKEKHGRLLSHAGTIISVFVVVASIVLFNYNLGYSRAYNLPVDVMSVSMTNLLPLATQICGGGLLIIAYIRHLLTDRLLGRYKYSIMRLFYGFVFCLNLIVANQFQAVLGIFFSFALSLIVSSFVELCVYFRGRNLSGKKKNDKVIDKFSHDFLVEEYVFSSVFPGYRNGIIIFVVLIILILSSSFGSLSANAKREYAVFEYQNESYAVIIDYTDKSLAQKAVFDEKSIEVDTNTFYYFDKSSMKLAYVKFDKATINKPDIKSSLAIIQSTPDTVGVQGAQQ